jgi:hypothetical protein
MRRKRSAEASGAPSNLEYLYMVRLQGELIQVKLDDYLLYVNIDKGAFPRGKVLQSKPSSAGYIA